MSTVPGLAEKSLLARVQALEHEGRALDGVILLLAEIRAMTTVDTPNGRIEVEDFARRMVALNVWFRVEKGTWPDGDAHMLVYKIEQGRFLRHVLIIRPANQYTSHWLDEPTDDELAALAVVVQQDTDDLLARHASDKTDSPSRI